MFFQHFHALEYSQFMYIHVHVAVLYLKPLSQAVSTNESCSSTNYLMQLVSKFYLTWTILYFSGSRMNKQWFLVRDSRQEIDAVLTMVPWSLQCTLTFNRATRKTLKELFSLLQVCMLHVYTYNLHSNGSKLHAHVQSPTPCL